MTYAPRFCLAVFAMLAAIPQAWADDASPVPGCGTNGISSPKITGPHAMPEGAYPVISMVQGEQGTVTLEFTIQPDGSVSNPQILKTSGYPRLDEAAAENVTAWKYGAGVKDGKPAACRWRANVVWHLHDEPSIFPENGPFGIVKLGPSDYPSSALRRKESGAAAFIVAVDEKGKKMATVMVRSSGFADLDGASDDYLKEKVDVKPAELSGKPIATFVNIVIIWTLDQPTATP